MIERSEETVGETFSLVTVLYHSTTEARKELEGWAHVVEQLADRVEWVVIDNSEDEADREFFDRYTHIENIRFRRQPHNPGFAASSNLGAEMASNTWLVFLNPDIMPDMTMFTRVMDAVALQKDTGATFAVGQITGSLKHQGICLIRNVWFSDRPQDSSMPLIGPSGGFGIVKRAQFLDFQGFVGGLFAWGEDAELAIRMSKAGVPCIGINEYFLHSGGHSFKAVPTLRQRKVWLLGRNRQLIAWQHFSVAQLFFFEFFVLCITVLKSPVHIRNRTLGALLRGNGSGFGRSGNMQDPNPARLYMQRNSS
ncbi:hypothetical protein C3B59_05120 [Cryobacterium zongtaii]|uniref:Glycosyltransferase 2-like domain-containing protein n=1 Tax=Cryobacterium zongtaii TaxID=1259217 RepID=A0A2S3ZM18_9MICO|nr:glycosyltransferase [Cryobacterium zongtaii]POH69727.1 hypothetical protein C3B59_05120 [Cryobacterium zongtaii]